MNPRILLVDDDVLSLSATQMLLEGHHYRVDTASTGKEATQLVEHFGGDYSLVLLDYRLPDEAGEATAKRLLEQNPDLYILMYSGDTTQEAVKETWKAGAVGFLEKGGEPAKLLAEVANWCSKHRQIKQVISLPSSMNENSEVIHSIQLIGRSKKLADIAKQARRYAGLKDGLLLLGETGTGKEKIARACHSGSSKTFFPINCAAYAANTELMEADLFGYEKGSFTGAVKDHVGIFEAAKGGTVFLDEVHTLNKVAQQKLLRVLQEKKIRRVGTTREIAVDFRLIAAAKPELELLIESEEFLPDLFERLNVLRIEIPPLRERKEDIAPLVAYFCTLYEKETGEHRAVLYKTLEYLENYSWPRNVRELENTIRRLCVNVPTEKIAPEHLDARFFERENLPLLSEKDELMKAKIETALKLASSQRDAARRLKIPESSLRRMMKKYHIAQNS